MEPVTIALRAAPLLGATTVDGEAPDQFQIVLGPYAASTLTLIDDDALEGGLFAVGALTLSDTSALAGATDILAGTTLAASGSTSDQSNVEVNGSGASFTTAGALTQGDPSTGAGGDLYVVDGASLQAGSWTVGGFVFVDAAASATVGAAPAGQKGAVAVEHGATLTLDGGASVAVDVNDAGTVTAGSGELSGTATISGGVSGDGVLGVLSDAALTITGATSGLSAITIADGTSATAAGRLSLGAVSGAGAIAVGAYGELTVSGLLQDTGAISFGADAAGSFEQVVDPGEIDVGQAAHVTFGGDVSGSSALKIASGATVSVDAKLSGLSGVTLANGATLNFVKTGDTTGADVNVPISLAGDDVIGVQDGVAVDGAVTGFDVTDAIVNTSLQLEAGGTIVTDATLGAGGVLEITTDGAQIASVHLSGSYAGQRFLTVGVGEGLPDGETLIGLAASTAALPAGGAVTGGSGASFQLLTGSGSGPGLSFTGDNAVVGTASTDDLTVSGSASATLETLLVEAGGSVAASGAADVQTAAEVDGAGAALTVAGGLTLGGGPGEPELAAVNGGRVRLGGLNITGVAGSLSLTTYDAAILVDPTGAIEVGSSGGAVAGALSVDAGAVVTSRTLNAIIIGDVVDAGTVEVAAPADPDVFLSSLLIRGSVSGSGSLRADDGTMANVAGSVTGLGTLAVGAGSQLFIGGSLDTAASISTGEGSYFSVGGTTGAVSALTTGAGSFLSLAGAATGLGPIVIGQTALAFFGSLSGTGAMQIDQGATVLITGTVSLLPQITLGASVSLSLLGADKGVGIAFKGGTDKLTFATGIPVTGALTGFDGTDLLVDQDAVPAVDGGRIVTGAAYAATGPGVGTLTLTDDGTVLNTLTLSGSYTPGEFLTNAALVNDATAGVTDVALAGPTQTGLSGPTVTGGSGFVFDVLAGSGASAGALAFEDNVAVEGGFKAAGVTDDGVLDIQAGASVTSTAGAAILSGAEVDGAGALLAAQSLTLGGGGGDADLLVVDGGAVKAASLTLASGSGGLGVAATTLYVDKAGSVEVGGAAAVAGAVDVAAGATLTAGASLGRIGAAVMDAGTISVVAPAGSTVVPDTLQIDGALSGGGALDVGGGQGATLVSGATGLSSIAAGAKSALTSDAAVSNFGTLELGASSTASITGGVTGAGGIGVGASASLTVNGALSGPGALVVGEDATATVSGDVSGLSGITLDAGATLDLGGDETGVPISIVGQGVTLDILPGASITGEITGFAHGDVIKVFDDLDAKIVTTATDAGGVLALADDGTRLGTLSLAGSYAGQQFISNVAGAGGYSDVVVSSPPCFAAGTRILTARGEVPVQALRSGDEVVVLDGAERALLPVRWIGRRRIDLSRHPNPAVAQPILIRADALADGAPVRDLLVSPDHALLLDGALVAARLLVNGGSVRRLTGLAQVWYLHVELERHAILLADGAAAESYLDTGNRMIFANGEECVRLHPDFADAADTARRAARSCAELLTDPGRLEAIWRRIAERAGEPADALRATRDPRARLRVAGRILAPAAPTGGGASRLTFALPRGADAARLVSRAAAPSETAPWHDDRRRLGLLVRGLTFRGPGGAVALPLDDARLACGWWDVEQADGEERRWTDGDALLPIPARAATLEVDLAAVGQYPLKTRSSPPAPPFADVGRTARPELRHRSA
jgi:hypothetical protein